jgi:hypothetical protein
VAELRKRYGIADRRDVRLEAPSPSEQLAFAV